MGTGARRSAGSSLPSHCSRSGPCPLYPCPSAGFPRATSPPSPGTWTSNTAFSENVSHIFFLMFFSTVRHGVQLRGGRRLCTQHPLWYKRDSEELHYGAFRL